MTTVLLCSLTVLLCSCFSQHQDTIDDVIEKSLKSKEGVDIRIDPIKEDTGKKA